MDRKKILLAMLGAAMIIMAACSNSKAPGEWVMLDTGTSDAFASVNFVNETVGWLNGWTDRAYAPPEGNENANANKNTNKNAKPKAPGKKPEDAFKLNQGFEVLQTTDGGKTWRQIPDQFKQKIRSVWFADPQIGWALTIDRDILGTTDGGATWSLQRKAGKVKVKITKYPDTEQPEQIDNLRFIDSNHGWAWGGGRKDEFSQQPGVFLVTIDGGKHWNDVAFPFDQTTSTIFFLDPLRGWASSEGGVFYKTTDGGLNWAKIDTKPPGDLVFRSIFFIDENTGWVAGRSGRMVKTKDGGKTWEKLFKVKDEFKIRDMFFLDSSRGWAVGDDGTILYTPDGGEDWVNVGAPAPVKLTDIVFVNNQAGWAVGLGGAMLKYQLEGRSE
jgi:photosystem II stability/assembly factor-like uncharacterized protein